MGILKIHLALLKHYPSFQPKWKKIALLFIISEPVDQFSEPIDRFLVSLISKHGTNSHKSSRMIEFYHNDTSFNQVVSVKIKNGCEDLILSVIYRSPNSSRVNDEALCNWMNGLSGTNLLIGDFNYPDIDWENGISGSRGRTFYETTADLYMELVMLASKKYFAR